MQEKTPGTTQNPRLILYCFDSKYSSALKLIFALLFYLVAPQVLVQPVFSVFVAQQGFVQSAGQPVFFSAVHAVLGHLLGQAVSPCVFGQVPAFILASQHAFLQLSGQPVFFSAVHAVFWQFVWHCAFIAEQLLVGLMVIVPSRPAIKTVATRRAATTATDCISVFFCIFRFIRAS
jgi:hypothetical protein